MNKLILLISLCGLNNASAQIINGDFNYWDTASMYGQPYIDPVGWLTNNETNLFGGADTPVTRAIDSAGYYARIESNAEGIDAILPGRLKQTILSHDLVQIAYNYKCDSISQAGSCVVNIYSGNSNTLLFTDSINTENISFQSRSIDILPDWNLQNDSITLEFVAEGYHDTWDEQEDGHSVFLIDNVKASYINSVVNTQSRENILVFPNPTRGELFVLNMSNDPPHTIEIWNTDGTLVYTIENEERIGIQNLQQGLYYLRYIIRNKVQIKPVVVIK